MDDDDSNPFIVKAKLRYEQRCREEAASGASNVSVAEDAMLVVFEWGGGIGLDQAWRLEKRQPLASSGERASALATALEIREAAYELMKEPWRSRPVDDDAINRAADAALWTLSVAHPHLERDSLRRAIRNANYVYWHDGGA